MVVKRERRPKATSARKKKQQLEDKQINNRDWPGFVDCLLELVLERLPLVDRLSFGSVCKPWRNIATKYFERCSRGIPILVKPGQSENKGRKCENKIRTCLNVLDKKENTLGIDIRMPEEYIGSHIWGSYHDWLFLVRPIEGHIHITMLNPFSGEKVVLPKTLDKYDMIVLSSFPSDPKCIYMLNDQSHGLAFWTPSARGEWRRCFVIGSLVVVDALHYEGHFYLLGCCYNMVIIDEKTVLDMLNNSIDGDCFPGTAFQYLVLKPPCLEIWSHVRRYIVESNGDILLVCRIFYDDGPHEAETHGFKTYKLDVSRRAWVEVESFGDYTIFLGRSCSRSFHAKEELGDGALANKIYFSNNKALYGTNEWEPISKLIEGRDDVDDWGVFSLRKESNSWPRAFTEPGKCWAGVWVTAPLW